MPSAPSYLRAALLCCPLLLAACGGLLPTRPPAPATPQEPAPLAQAVAAIEAGELDRAERLLEAVDPATLGPGDRLLLRTMQAQIALRRDNPVAALALAPHPDETGNRELAAYAALVRAQALFALDDPAQAVRLLVRREALLDAPEAIAHNRDLIWSGLHRVPLSALARALDEPLDPATRGWIELARIARGAGQIVAAREQQMRDWQRRHPDHPGWRWRDVPVSVPDRAPDRIAVLLPLQEPYADLAAAIRDGTMAAWYAQAPPRPALQLIDSGTDPEALDAAWQRALEGDADLVIGPLLKPQVERLMQRPPAVPTLALNQAEPVAGTPPAGLYQFALAPEDEARAAARLAAVDGKLRALALLPDNGRGDRLLGAFAEELAAVGGSLRNAQRYPTNGKDPQAAIRALLGIDASRERHAALRAALGVPLQFETRRRQDVDYVFLAADAQDARKLLPTLQFHHAGDLPVYATANVHEPGQRSPELDGLRFCDVPLLLSSQPPMAALRARLERLFGERARRHMRLYALGHDALALAEALHAGHGEPLDGASGRLRVAADGRVSRELACARFVRGRAELLPEPWAPQQPDEASAEPAWQAP